FLEFRRAQAEKLFELAQTALEAKQYPLAYELARETVRENPDHEAARRVLGYRKHADRWVLPETARRLDAGQVWSEQFGWLPASQLPRYEQGERFYRGRWISADEDAKLHNNIRNGWNIETEHYNVVSYYSLEEGVRLATRLESLYDAWRQVFL